ncbi:MAG: VTT domain-containing protein [Acidobacteriales bacterium]|nr:VTT domain-containing protein [Terriglobales bacterium]
MSGVLNYAFVFTATLAENIGLPVPAWPLIVISAATAVDGSGSVAVVFLLATVAAVAADYAWFLFGRKRGRKVLKLLCSLSLNPDSCVHKTESNFERHGLKSLLVAKFVPGLNTIAPPMAGMLRTSSSKFLLFDTTGAALWAGTAVFVGYIWHRQVEAVLAATSRFGRGTLLAAVVLLLAFAAFKYYQRRRYYASLRAARLRPAEVNSLLQQGNDVVIVDLRSHSSLKLLPSKVPGALLITPEEFEKHWRLIPRERDVVMYCT